MPMVCVDSAKQIPDEWLRLSCNFCPSQNTIFQPVYNDPSVPVCIGP